MLNKCCILACVTSQTSVVGRLSKNRGLPMASRGQKRTITGQLHRFPRRALRNALALGSTRSRPTPNSNLGTQRCAQGLPNSAATQAPYVPKACQNPKETRGAHDPRRVHQTVLRRGCRRKQHYEATRFGLSKHIAILAEATTIRLLFKAFPSVFQGKS